MMITKQVVKSWGVWEASNGDEAIVRSCKSEVLSALQSTWLCVCERFRVMTGAGVRLLNSADERSDWEINFSCRKRDVTVVRKWWKVNLMGVRRKVLLPRFHSANQIREAFLFLASCQLALRRRDFHCQANYSFILCTRHAIDLKGNLLNVTHTSTEVRVKKIGTRTRRGSVWCSGHPLKE